MRLKLGLALILAVMTISVSATIAMADNGPHGGFTATTDACAGCHRAHTAVGPEYLLVAADIEALCLSCHDGTGAYTNVVDGYYAVTTVNQNGDPRDPGFVPPATLQGDDGHGLFGGGFVNARMRVIFTGQNRYDATLPAPVSAPVTSMHTVDGAIGTVWGSGAIGSGNNGGTMTLECTSCHDPHGKAGRNPTGGFVDPIASYRLLRFNPIGSNGFEGTAAYFTGTFVQTGPNGGVYVADPATKWYTPNTDVTIDPSVAFWRARRSAVTQPWGPYINWIQGVGDYSGRNYTYQRPAIVASGNTDTSTQLLTCADPNTGGPPVGTANPVPCAPSTGTAFNNTTAFTSMAMWCGMCHDRHLAGSGARINPSGDPTFMFRHTATGSSLACTSCHVAHGTSATMTGLAQTGTLVPPAVGSEANNSVLLKTNSRSICLDCHAADINFYTGVVTPVDPNP